MAKFKDLTGKKFGKLTAIKVAGNVEGRYWWECLCDCKEQKKFIFAGAQLNSGITKSCGCLTSPSEEEFNERIKTRLKENSKWNGDCLEWTGKQRHHFGYGLISIKKKSTMAHRASYKIHIGPIPKGSFVLHSCDNPRCINPKHLWIGNAKDNSTDMVKKKRQNNHLKASKGIKNNAAKITDQDVINIYNRYKNGEDSLALAKEFNLSRSTIYKIAGNRLWKHVKR